MAKRYNLFIVVGLLLILLGCSSTTPPVVHISPDVDMSFIKRVAVLPFKNLSEDRNAGEIVREMVINELLASGLVDVAYTGDVMAAMKRQRIKDPTSLSSKQIRRLAKDLKVQAVIVGTVSKYGMVRLGSISAPEVTITLMMADAGSGSIIWSVTLTRGGAGFMARHFGAKADTLSETALKVVREAILTLYEY